MPNNETAVMRNPYFDEYMKYASEAVRQDPEFIKNLQNLFNHPDIANARHSNVPTIGNTREEMYDRLLDIYRKNNPYDIVFDQEGEYIDGYNSDVGAGTDYYSDRKYPIINNKGLPVFGYDTDKSRGEFQLFLDYLLHRPDNAMTDYQQYQQYMKSK